MINVRTWKPLWKSTIKQREGLWRQFLRETNSTPPVSPDVVFTFLEAVALRVSARHVRDLFRVVRREHELLGFDHLSSDDVHATVRSIARGASGGSVRMAQLIDKRELATLVESIGRKRLIDLRDTAIVLVHLAGWLTREQCATLDIERIEALDGVGYVADVGGPYPKSITIPRVDHDPLLCPVRSLNRYLRRLQRDKGCAFPCIWYERALERPIGAKGIQKMIALRLKASGIYRPGLGMSSLRFSGLQAALMGGDDRQAIEEQAGWRGWDTYDKAVERAHLYAPFDSEDL